MVRGIWKYVVVNIDDLKKQVAIRSIKEWINRTELIRQLGVYGLFYNRVSSISFNTYKKLKAFGLDVKVKPNA